MKFSHKWLQIFFEDKLPTASELGDKLGVHSFELEGYEEKGNDILIDLDILPNRSSDCMSYKGIAQEISALFGLKLKDNIFKEPKTDQNLKTSDFLSLKVEDRNLVKRATKRLAVDVKIKESPEWLKEILQSIGQKSINNVVDITNYVMWMTGQPVHAFDYDKLSGDKDFKNIAIRFAKDGEKITDLSGVEHELDSTMLVIADEEKALDIAGIKGGMDSGVDENTTRVVLSAVNFGFENIRNTSKKLKLRTDASARFENDVPLFRLENSLNLFASLMEDLAEAKVSFEVLDTFDDKLEEKEIEISLDTLNSKLGMKVESNKVVEILNSLNLITEFNNDIFTVKVPLDRTDLNIKEDIVEEVGRIIGYDNIPAVFPTEGFKFPKKSIYKESLYKVIDYLVSEGFFEMQMRVLTNKGVVELLNPFTSELDFLKDNLLEGLLEKAKKELVNLEEPKLFEVSKVFVGYESKTDDRVVNEYYSFAGVIGKKKIKEKNKEDLFFRTKGYLEKIFEILSIKNIKWVEAKDDNFIADIYNGDEKIGSVGVNYWEINFEILIKFIDTEVDYKEISKYPKMDRDVAFWVSSDFKVEDAKKIIKDILPKEAIEFKLFDIYNDKENNRKSFAFKIIFQSYEKTLSDDFANEAMDKIYNILKENNFEIR